MAGAQYLREAELKHGLFSMLAALGFLVTREASRSRSGASWKLRANRVSDGLAWDPLNLLPSDPTVGLQPAVFFVANQPYRPAPARVHAEGPRSKVAMMPIGVPKVASRLPGALSLAAYNAFSAALNPPQLLAGNTTALFLTAPPKSVDKDGALAKRLATLTSANAFVVAPTLHEPAPLALPTVELFVAADVTKRREEERDPQRAALEAAAGNAWARSDARAHRIKRLNEGALVRATVTESSEPALDWALGRARRLLTARRSGCVDVLCAIEDDDDVFEDMVEIFTSGVRGEAARRADPTEPLARLVRVDSAVVPEDLARREEAYVDAAVAGCRATVVDWESAAAFRDAEHGGAS